MVATASVDDAKRMPEILKEDVFAKNGNNGVPTVEFVAARRDRAGIELFILFDDASVSSLGTSLRTCATSSRPSKRGAKLGRTTLVQCALIAQRYSPKLEKV